MSVESFVQVRVTPRAARDDISGWREDVLQVRLRAPPVEGQANESLRRLLAERLGIRASDIEVVSGERSRLKRLRIQGVDQGGLRARLGV